jgi:hypothetical protein
MCQDKDNRYTGLINYVTEINKYMGVDFDKDWILYGFPVLSFLTDLTTKTPHSGVYILSEHGVEISEDIMNRVHALLIATLYPIDQLYLIRELERSVKYKEQISRVRDHAEELLQYIKPLQGINNTIDAIAVILDPTYWTPGISEYKELQKKLFNIFEIDKKHDVENHTDAELLDHLLKDDAFAKAKHGFISKGKSSSLIEDKVFEKIIEPWEYKYIHSQWINAMYLAKALSKLNQLPVYWLHVALLEDLDYTQRPNDIHQYFIKTSDIDYVISCLVAAAKLQREATVINPIINESQLTFTLKFALQDGKTLENLNEFINTIQNLMSDNTGQSGGQSTRAFRVLVSAGMKILNTSMLPDDHALINVCFEVIKMK